jgi:hypothetical protein
MNKDIKIYLTLVVIVLIVIGIIYYIKNVNQETLDEQTMKCIASKSIMYSQTACSHCIAQKQILGDYVSLFNIIECDKDIKKCQDEQITGTPTWIINNQKTEGTHTLNELKVLAGC